MDDPRPLPIWKGVSSSSTIPSSPPHAGGSSRRTRCPQPAASRGEQPAERWLSRDAQLQNESAAATGRAWPRSSLEQGALVPTAKGSGHPSPRPHPCTHPSRHARGCLWSRSPAAAGIQPHPGMWGGGLLGGVGKRPQALGSSRWQSLKGRKQVGRTGGPSGFQNPSAPPVPAGRNGLLVVGLGCSREHRGVPHGGAGVGADPIGTHGANSPRLRGSGGETEAGAGIRGVRGGGCGVPHPRITAQRQPLHTLTQLLSPSTRAPSFPSLNAERHP